MYNSIRILKKEFTSKTKISVFLMDTTKNIYRILLINMYNPVSIFNKKKKVNLLLNRKF